MVDVADVSDGEHVAVVHLTKHGQLSTEGLVDRVAAAAQDQVWLDARRHERPHAVLRGLGLLLAGAQHRNQADVHKPGHRDTGSTT